jgi:hypothetical protein
MHAIKRKASLGGVGVRLDRRTPTNCFYTLTGWEARRPDPTALQRPYYLAIKDSTIVLRSPKSTA